PSYSVWKRSIAFLQMGNRESMRLHPASMTRPLQLLHSAHEAPFRHEDGLELARLQRGEKQHSKEDEHCPTAAYLLVAELLQSAASWGGHSYQLKMRT